jgi:hypothetical protein
LWLLWRARLDEKIEPSCAGMKMVKPNLTICRAQTRSGKPCQKKPAPGDDRCAQHEGRIGIAVHRLKIKEYHCEQSHSFRSENFPLIDKREGRITAQVFFWGGERGLEVRKNRIEYEEAKMAAIAPFWRSANDRYHLERHREEIARLAETPAVEWGDIIVLTLYIWTKALEVGRFKVRGQGPTSDVIYMRD